MVGCDCVEAESRFVMVLFQSLEWQMNGYGNWLNGNWQGKAICWERNLSRRHFVHHKTDSSNNGGIPVDRGLADLNLHLWA
jgi:hypothetical protein